MSSERFHPRNNSGFSGFTSKIQEFVFGQNSFLERRRQNLQYKKRREDFINNPFSPVLRPELFEPAQEDPSIIEGEFRVIEPNRLPQPQSTDK